MFNFDDANKKSKEALDVAVKSYSAMDYGDFVLSGKLAKLEVFNTEECK